MSASKRPVQDAGLPKPEVPFRAGGKNQGSLGSRKNALSDTGSVGYVPGHSGTRWGSSADAGHVHETSTPTVRPPAPGDDELEPLAMRRPMPRETPVSSTPTHTGSIVRFLDGHSEIHRERPGLAEMASDPGTPDDIREAVRDEIAQRDALHNHRYW